MYHFRGVLIRTLVKRCYDVTVIVPPGDYIVKLQSLGCKVILLPMARFINPIADIRMIFSMYKIFRFEKFDIVHNMTIKPNIFGSIAARMAGTKRVVCLISGTGFAFTETDRLLARILQFVVKKMYRLAMLIVDNVWFQNPDDLDEFVKLNLISEEKAVVIKSGGIDPKEYSMSSVMPSKLELLRSELGISQTAKCVVMVAARMIWSKGVREFIQASHALQEPYPEWRFIMLCPKDQGTPDAVPQEYINEQQNENLVVVDSFRDDAKSFLALADIVVLISYYREGVPRTLLEALALGKPILTSVNPGCKEVVEDGKNGYKIPAKNTEALVSNLKTLMENNKMREDFGEHSMFIAKRDFDSKIIIDRIVRELYLIQ
jgi:N,N'-diacetylbacillosaminyl-diphospho-undecaprenol alpha-1,3-N-acetylgalactosaminyltransferase